MPALASTLRQAVAVDRGAFAPLRGLRAALGVALVLGFGIAIGQPTAGVFATIGALTSGTVSLSQGVRPPLATMAGAGLALAVSAGVGGLTAGQLVVELVILAIWAGAAGLASGASQSAGTVGVQAVVGLVVLGRFPLDLHAALAAGGEVLLGAATQIVLSVVIRPPVRDRVERRALAQVADALAAWAHDGGRSASRQIGDRTDTVRQLFDDRGRWSEATPLRSVLTSLSRSRLEISVLTRERDRRRSETGAAEVLRAVAADLAAIAEELRTGRASRRTGDDLLALELTDGDGLVQHRARALAGQLRAAQLSFQEWGEQPRHGLSAHLRRPSGVGELAEAFRHPTPVSVRHAIRLAALLPLCEGLARVLPVQRGYWLALTAVVVLKPDFASSFKRGIARVIGTLVGVVPVSIAVGLTHPRGFILVLLVFVLTWAAYATFVASFAVYSACLAGFVVVLLDIVSPGGSSIAGARAIDTLLGGALALLTYLALPSWEGPQIAATVAALIEAEDGYAGHVLRAAVRGRGDPDELSTAATGVRRARSTLEATLGRAEVEPALLTGTSGAQGIRVARDTLAATSRIVASLHVLHTQAADDAGIELDCPAVEPFVAALHDVLDETARSVRGESVLHDAVDLRRVASPIVTVQPGASVARCTLAREVDELVDAVDSLRFTLGELPRLTGAGNGAGRRTGLG